MNKKNIILTTTISICIIVILIFVQYVFIIFNKSDFTIKRVAHAGGGIENKTYTNSINALDLNIKKGFSYFEIDFIFTSDNKLVCLHDWNGGIFKMTFGFENKKILSLSEFLETVKNKSEFNICTLDSLVEWMKMNPTAYIITDIKNNNLKALMIMSEIVPNFENRIIPQIYIPEEYNTVKKMGYKQIIWTLYNYKGSNDQILKEIKNFKGRFAITMPTERAKTGLAIELAKQNIPTYVHTINSIEIKNEYLNKYGVTDVYTDFLSPEE